MSHTNAHRSAKRKTVAEMLIETHLGELRLLPYVAELRFAPPRQWRFDYAVERLHLAIEIEGGIHQFRNKFGELTTGAHVRGAHYQSDLDKYNEATARGWRVFRFSTEDIELARDIRCLKLWIVGTRLLESGCRGQHVGKAETATRDKNVDGAADSGESRIGGTRAVSRPLHV